MKVCQKCGVNFPFRTNLNGKKINLQNRKYCLNCSPFGNHNTKKLIDIELEPASCLCKDCDRSFFYERSKGGSKDKCNSCWTAEKRRKIKQDLVEYKGGICECCGINNKEFLSIYDFHHKDTKEKDILISGSYCRSIESLKKEVDKCMLVCSNCHRIIHEGLNTVTRKNL